MRRRLASHVQAVLYIHADDRQDYVHIFGDHDPELRTDAQGRQWLRVDNLPRITHVAMLAGAAGAHELTLRHRHKLPISRDGF